MRIIFAIVILCFTLSCTRYPLACYTGARPLLPLAEPTCVDTTDTQTGYTFLCRDNIIDKDSVLNLNTQAKYTVTDSGVCYKLFYYASNPLLRQSSGSEFEKKFFGRLTTSCVIINDERYTGCLKIAEHIPGIGISTRYSIINIHVLYYKEGKLLRQQFLYDVDLADERRLIRPT